MPTIYKFFLKYRYLDKSNTFRKTLPFRWVVVDVVVVDDDDGGGGGALVVKVSWLHFTKFILQLCFLDNFLVIGCFLVVVVVVTWSSKVVVATSLLRYLKIFLLKTLLSKGNDFLPIFCVMVLLWSIVVVSVVAVPVVVLCCESFFFHLIVSTCFVISLVSGSVSLSSMKLFKSSSL